MSERRKTDWGWRDARTGRWTSWRPPVMEPVEPGSEIARAFHHFVMTRTLDATSR